jgi:outer membrane protein assembly factor BamB
MHFVENGTPRVNDCDLEGPNKDLVDGQMSGIWGRPGVVFDEQLNRIYAATGNGLFDANTSGGFEWGDSVLALHPDGTGSGMGWPVDSYTPGTFAQLYSDDWDLGSTSPAIVPSTSAKYPHIALQGGKDACLRLINLDDMSGLSGPGHVGGELYLTCGGQYLGPIFGQPAVWVNSQDNTTWLFVPTHGGQLLAFQLVVDSLGDVSLDQKWASPDMVIGSPIIAGGVLYYEGIKDAISNHVTAVDPTTGSIIWGDVNNGGNWQCPVVTNGHIYFLDAYSQLSAYLLDGIFRDGMSD